MITPAPRTFWYPSKDRYVLFTPDALMHMYQYQQNCLWDREAGGELFAPNPNEDGIVIAAAAGPSSKDIRKRHFFNQDPDLATRERENQSRQGLEAIGLWHTHPQKIPAPSEQDKRTAKQYYDNLEGTKDRYLLVVVGKGGEIPALSVWSVGAAGWEMLPEEHGNG